MAAPAGSLAAAETSADGKLTVLDDKIDVEDHVAFLWLKAHQLKGNPHLRVVIGSEVLPNDWVARKKVFITGLSAESYLQAFVKFPAAMHSLQTLAASVTGPQPKPPTKAEIITIVAAALLNNRLWLIELPKHNLTSRYQSKASADTFAPLNPRYGSKVDFNFIASLEGDQWLRGYVPFDGKTNKVAGRSGMTVASGFDIGQLSAKQLDKYAFSDTLKAKLKPFVAPNNFKGLTKAQVATAVGKLGPVPIITKTEADLCDNQVFDKHLSEAINLWNASISAGVPVYTALPSGWQTVWLSRVYQEGSGPKFADAINFRAAATAGDWQLAITRLRAYSKYKDRIGREAALLAKEIPPPVTPPKAVKK